jgi:hypothetical protein
VELQEYYYFELVGWQNIRIKIFRIPRERNTNSYPMRTGDEYLLRLMTIIECFISVNVERSIALTP